MICVHALDVARSPGKPLPIGDHRDIDAVSDVIGSWDAQLLCSLHPHHRCIALSPPIPPPDFLVPALC